MTCCAKDSGTAMRQRKIESMLPDEKAVQIRFIHHAAMKFIRSQRINLWWNSEERNEKFSRVFNASLMAILDGKYEEAKRLRRKAAFGFVKWPVRCFSWLLYAEAEFFCKMLGRKMPTPDNPNWPFASLPMKPNGGRYSRFQKSVSLDLPKSRILAKAYTAFASFRDSETKYAHLPMKNCIVCATMGAGKSTFINALLGMDVLPARNSATTAKVTSVYDKDGTGGLVGFAQNTSGEFTKVRDGVDAKAIDGWNSDAGTSRIFLQGDLDGIPNKGFKVAVHDTPGTNNSGDDKHHQITKEFLRETPADAIVYVANTEHLCATDEHALLQELYSEVIRPRGTPVLFVLNKADSIDTEKESLSELLEQYKAYLAGIGFSNPTVCPVSSKAARLLKMAIKGQADRFSIREEKEFPGLVGEFTEFLTLDDTTVLSYAYGTEDSISINEVQYAASLLRMALMHTGIHKIETELEALLTSPPNGTEDHQ